MQNNYCKWRRRPCALFDWIKAGGFSFRINENSKAKSSKYINDHTLTPGRFEWQEGYGVFSYGQSQVDKVYKYIQNQEAHHKKQTFRDEYLEFLKKFKIDYDEKYIFQELI